MQLLNYILYSDIWERYSDDFRKQFHLIHYNNQTSQHNCVVLHISVFQNYGCDILAKCFMHQLDPPTPLPEKRHTPSIFINRMNYAWGIMNNCITHHPP